MFKLFQPQKKFSSPRSCFNVHSVRWARLQVAVVALLLLLLLLLLLCGLACCHRPGVGLSFVRHPVFKGQ